MLVCLCCAEKKIINKCKRCWRNLESIIIVILSMHERHRAHVGTNDNLQIVIVAVCSNDNLQIFYHSRVQQKQFHRLRRRCVLLSVPSRCCSIFLPSLLQLCFYCCCCFVFTVAVALSLLLLLLCRSSAKLFYRCWLHVFDFPKQMISLQQFMD